jgi:phage tail-like protein
VRGPIDGLSSPHPLELALPVLYQSDPSPALPGRARLAGDRPPEGAYVVAIPAAERSSTQEADAAEDLAGEWILLLVDEPERLVQAVTLIRDGERVTTGTVRYVAEHGATFTTADCREVEGKYTWRFDVDSLSLVAVDDPCAPRQRLLTAHPWRRRNFATRFMSAFDGGLAPVLATLDNIDAYFDPRLAPEDFVDWLSGWVGLTPNQRWPLRRRRDYVARAARLFRRWGTVRGVKEFVAIFAGVHQDDVTIEENGGVATSPTPGGDLPGRPEPRMKVTVKVADPSTFDVELLTQVVKAARPAHLVAEVEVVGE